MRFKITLKDKTVIYVNDICIFGAIDGFHLSTWARTDRGLILMEYISMDKVRTITDNGMLIYC